MAITNDTPAGNTKTLSVSPAGNLSRPLGPDVAPLSEILTDLQSSEISQVMTILITTLHSIIINTTSGDALELSIYHAQAMCKSAGIDEVAYKKVLAKFVAYSNKVRRRCNPLSY